MNDVWIFAVGSVIFIFLTWATIVFLSFRLNELYRDDLASAPGGADIVMEGSTEVAVPTKRATER